MPKTIKVNDKMQKEYSYRLIEPIGENFDPEFKPELTGTPTMLEKILKFFPSKYWVK
jgi:hypothetical protein